MSGIIHLFEQNKKWSERMIKDDPEFFSKLAQEQSPDYLWIGCSDSRVPANQVIDLKPGSVFVHRNVANLVIHTDANMLSVVYYAITQLKVKHVLVCGHYGCGGILAAMSNESLGFIDNWLTHIKDVYDKHYDELKKIDDFNLRAKRLVELNVTEQVLNLAKVTFIQNLWEEGEFPYIHGIVYGLDDGKIKDLGVTINSLGGVREVFHKES